MPKMKINKLLSLKSKNSFNSIFNKGSYHKKNNIGVRFYKENEKYYVGYAVSKKSFNKAVDRNLIKRRMRSEVHRLSNIILKNCFSGSYLFIYLGGDIPSSKSISTDLLAVTKKFTRDT